MYVCYIKLTMMSHNNMNNTVNVIDTEEYDSFNEIEIDFEKIINNATCIKQHSYRFLRITYDEFTNVCLNKGSFTLLSVSGAGYSKWYWYHSFNRGLLFVIKGSKGWTYYEGMPKQQEVKNFNKTNVIKSYLKRDKLLSLQIQDFIELHLLHSIDKLNEHFILEDHMLYELNVKVNMLDNKGFYELMSLEQLIKIGN